MLLTFGLILVFVTGAAFLSFLSYKSWTLPEYIGLSFLVGLFQTVLLLCLFDMVGIGLYSSWILCANGVMAAVWVWLGLRRNKGEKFMEYLSWKRVLRPVNIVWLLFLGFIIYIEWLNFEKCLFFPTFDRDSIVGFDTYGYLMAWEHTLHALSIFQAENNPFIHNPGSYISYVPFVQVAYSYVYLLGAETSKTIPALVFLSFLFAFYGVLNRKIGGTGAMIGTFFTLMAPEMIAFSNMSGTNVIHAAYASLGTIYGLLWLQKNNQGLNDFYLWISAVLLSANCMTRSEGIVFPMALGIWVLVKWARKKLLWKEVMKWGLTVAIPFVGWKIFQKITGMTTPNFAEMPPFIDGEKMNAILTAVYHHLTNPQFYGWTFIAAFLAFLLSLYFVVKKKETLMVFGVICVSLLFYILILYHIDYVWDSMYNVLAYSAKRYLFCFVPLAWYFTLTVFPISKGLQKIDGKLSFVRTEDPATYRGSRRGRGRR